MTSFREDPVSYTSDYLSGQSLKPTNINFKFTFSWYSLFKTTNNVKHIPGVSSFFLLLNNVALP